MRHSNHRTHQKPNRLRVAKSTPSGAANKTYWLYGTHPVNAALANKNRRILRILATSAGAKALIPPGAQDDLPERPLPEPLDPKTLPEGVAEWAVHQGLLAQVRPLPESDPALIERPETNRLVVLDQVTDPQNMGAILRTCAVFGVDGVVVPRHNAPGETGAMAKAASGALEVVPVLRVANLARSLDLMKKSGLFVIGLAGAADQAIADFAPVGRYALVAGAEGHGLRRLVGKHCDATVALPVANRATAAGIDSLNVGAAIAVALHELVRYQ